MRMLPILCACLIACGAGLPAAMGQGGTGGGTGSENYDRILTADDITLTPVFGTDGTPGGWRVRATAWLANASADGTPRDLGCRVSIAVNGVVVSNTAQSVMVTAGGGGNTCFTSCVSDGWCASCKPSIILPGTCYCCNHAVSTEAVVPSLAAGDVVTAWAVPLEGSAPELAASNDRAVKIVPIPGGANRAVKPSMVHYGRTAEGTYALAGEVDLRTELDGTVRDLSYDVLVLVNGVPMDVNPPGNPCSGGTAIITVGAGTMLGTVPPLFLCEDFCLHCRYNGMGQPTGNMCIPPAGSGPSGNPWCMCDTMCNTARIMPGYGWQVEVPQLPPSTEVAVHVTPHGPGLPETVTSDDAVLVRVADIALCRAQLADVGRQGGLPGGDGSFDNNDFVVFIGHFFDADPRADLGAQGGIFGSDDHYDNNDFVVFVDLFFTGC